MRGYLIDIGLCEKNILGVALIPQVLAAPQTQHVLTLPEQVLSLLEVAWSETDLDC
jgi:hypothetical protein